MKPVTWLAFLAIAVLLSPAAGAQAEKYSTVKIYTPADKQQRAALVGLLQIDHFYETEDGAIVSEISETAVARLHTARHKYEILVDDVAAKLAEDNAKYYARVAAGDRLAFERTGSRIDDIIVTPAAFQVKSTFGGYYSFSEMNTAMNQLVASYPTIAQKFSLGQSHQGNDIWCIKISDNVATDEANEPEVLFMGLQHAREAIGGSSMIFLMQYLCEQYFADSRIRDLVDNREIFIIPCMNPDGWEYNRNNGGAGSGWRKNRRNNGGGSYGVDLNRNWGVDWGNCSSPIVGNPGSCGSSDPSNDTYYGPSAFSEPETQAVRNFTYSRHLVAMIDQHAYGPYYSLPFGRPSLPANTMNSADDRFYTYVSAAMGHYNGMRAGNSPQSVGYEVAGGVKDWMLKGNIGTGTKGKVMGLTGEGGAGGGTAGTYGSFWAPASQIVNLCKGMTFQNLQLLYAAGSYVDIQDAGSMRLTSLTGTLNFHVRRVGLEDKPVTITAIPLENIQSVGAPVTINSLANYYDTYNGGVSYTLPAGLANGKRVQFVWQIQTGGCTWYDTITKFYNPQLLFSDNMEGSDVTTNWTVTGGWNYSNETSYSGSKSLTESPGGLYTANSTRRATYKNTFNLSDATAAWLSFWVKHRAENFRDKLQVQVSTDGSTWTAIAGTTTVQEPGTLDGSTINGKPSLTGIRDVWTKELFDLSAWIGTPNLSLRFEFTSGPNNSFDFAQDDGFQIDNLEVIKSTTPLITLPVHFISFTGRLQPNNTVRLEWKAVTDELHDYFEVERSADGTRFTSIGRGPAQAPFYHIDATPAVGNNYYRIKQLDKDGTVTYSNTITVYYDPASFSIAVYPNPVMDMVSIKINSLTADRYTVSIADMAGKKVHEEQLSVHAAGTSEINIDFRQKAASVYMLTVKNGRNEIVASQKLVKQ